MPTHIIHETSPTLFIPFTTQNAHTHQDAPTQQHAPTHQDAPTQQHAPTQRHAPTQHHTNITTPTEGGGHILLVVATEPLMKVNKFPSSLSLPRSCPVPSLKNTYMVPAAPVRLRQAGLGNREEEDKEEEGEGKEVRMRTKREGRQDRSEGDGGERMDQTEKG
ncbi:hypothetical protein Pmani_004439 [Petrolisthes manimaculis]|uniref:Uncharacterized protein n=1 Tax=Petrolisthes manimaculis TaxID=1843537 RepID=A0AAE1ULK5_9EUCA|nr:hypothetical protein Pmani_004439 [Petrolisthes manimaculis]